MQTGTQEYHTYGTFLSPGRGSVLSALLCASQAESNDGAWKHSQHSQRKAQKLNTGKRTIFSEMFEPSARTIASPPSPVMPLRARSSVVSDAFESITLHWEVIKRESVIESKRDAGREMTKGVVFVTVLIKTLVPRSCGVGGTLVSRRPSCDLKKMLPANG